MNDREYLCLSLQEGVFVFVQSLLSKHSLSCLQIFLAQCCFPLVCTHKYMSMLGEKIQIFVIRVEYKYFTRYSYR